MALILAPRPPEAPLFEKEFPTGALEIEFEKALGVWRLFEDDARILCPRPVELDAERRVIRYTNLPSDETLTRTYTRFLQDRIAARPFLDLLHDAATAIARIHRDLRLSTRTEWQCPETFLAAARRVGFEFPLERLRETPHAFLHADCGFGNLQSIARSDGSLRLAVYDPSPNGHSTFAPDQFASIYLDLGSVLAALNGRVPLAQYPTIQWERMSIAKERFLESYERAMALRVDRDLAELCGFATAFASFSMWRGQGIRRFLAMSALYNRFKGNLAWIEELRRA